MPIDVKSPRATVVIYRHELLPASETFIPAQAEGLRRYLPVYLGLRRVDGLSLPEARVVALDNGGVSGRLLALRFQIVGPGPVTDILRRYEPALVHAHFEGDGMVALGLARKLDVPLLVTCHGFDVTVQDSVRWPNPLARAFCRRKRRQLQTSGAHFIAVSSFIRTAMLERGYPSARTQLHYIGVDQPEAPVAPLAQREPIVLFVGRLVEKKGAEYLIRALPGIQRAVPRARAVFIGEGPLRPRLEALALEIGARIELLGQRQHAEVLSWMRRARVLCIPTVRALNGDSDGCAMALVEAHAAGLPVVSFDTGGTGEAVIDGRTGWLAAAGDVSALTTGVVDLLRDDDRWRAFSEAGRLHARRRFDLRTQTAHLEDIYDALIAAHRRRRAEARASVDGGAVPPDPA